MPAFKSTNLLLPKSFVTSIIASIYILGFIITPYWNIYPWSKRSIAVLVITLFVGTIWCLRSASSLHFEFSLKNLIIFALLLIALAIMNYRQLVSGLPWRGDEDFHVAVTITLFQTVSNIRVLLLFFFFVDFFLIVWAKPTWGIPLILLFVSGAILVISSANPFSELDSGYLLRYPFLSYWFIAIPPAIATLVTNPYNEILYRLMPIVFACSIVYLYQKRLSTQTNQNNYLWAFAVATIPLVFYYSSILYLELPAIFLMLIVSFNIENLLFDDLALLKHQHAWYALILIGFIKETTIPFLLCFLIARWTVQLFRKKPFDSALIKNMKFSADILKSPLIVWLKDEIELAFLLLFPLFFYLLLRNIFTKSRSYVLNLGGLLHPEAYLALVRSLVDQFGPFLVLFLIGLGMLFFKKKYRVAGFILLTFLAYPLFFTIDHWEFVGYSRFNLYLVPSILVGASEVLSWIAMKKKVLNYGLVCALIALNLIITPINIDGTKKPYWDNYNYDTAEHYYPYREALYWLKERYSTEGLLFANLNYPYQYYFYFAQWHWGPKFETLPVANGISDDEALEASLKEAEKHDESMIIFHVLGKTIPQLKDTQHFRQEKVFQNMSHTLVIYKKINQ